MKDRLKKMLATKNERKADIVKKAESTADVMELRSFNGELDALNGEIRELEEMLKNADGQTEERTAAVNSQTPGIVSKSAEMETRGKPTDEADMEYRMAFKDFIGKKTPIPMELRANAVTKTPDVAAVIPIPIVNRIVEKLETIGIILPLVNKSSFPAGMNIPTASIKPIASWVAEGASSDRQKATVKDFITFTGHKLRCEIAWTQETDVMTLPVFETAFVNAVSKAMVRAQEQAILTGDGASQPKGILIEVPEEGQLIEVSELDYETLVEAEAALPQAYEGGAVWCMTKKTFMGFVGMTDDNGQPIARINYGIDGKPDRILLGRSVVLCGDYMDSFSATLEAGKIPAFIFNFEDYTLNTNYDMGIQHKRDWDTENYLVKAVMACDGKVVDKGSLVILKKK